MKFIDVFPLAVRTLKGNKLRSLLTMSIIAIGITALIGILTSIDVLKASLTQNFVSLGSNTFTVSQGDGLQRRFDEKNPNISFKEAEEFIKRYQFPAEASLQTEITSSAIVKTSFKETNPTVTVLAVDKNYMKVNGKNIMKGRSFSDIEIENGSNVAIIGFDLAANSFENLDSVIGATISVENKIYSVIGITEKKGSSAGQNDNFTLIPYLNAKREFDLSSNSIAIFVSVYDLNKIDLAIDEAYGKFRAIRKLNVQDEDNFFISKSDKLANTLISQISYISIATIIIGLLTLVGAGVGLMNIMLVSVNERTREIGIAKSLGATKKVIFDSNKPYPIITEEKGVNPRQYPYYEE